jgi:hypothetical protein
VISPANVDRTTFSLRFKANATVPAKVIATFYKNGASSGAIGRLRDAGR